MNFHSTKPLSYDSSDNQIYNPFLVSNTNGEERKSPIIDKQQQAQLQQLQQPVLKRAKSIVSSKSLSAFFTNPKSKHHHHHQNRDNNNNGRNRNRNRTRKRTRPRPSRLRRTQSICSNDSNNSNNGQLIIHTGEFKLPDQDEFHFTMNNSDNSFSSSFLSSSSSPSSSSSDLESVPDLTDDNIDELTPETTPIKPVGNFYFNTLFDNEENIGDGYKLNSQIKIQNELQQQQQQEKLTSPSIFEIPEIVYKIISYVDEQNTILPQESTPIRRNPLSYNHALLIHGDKKSAQTALQQTNKQINQQTSRKLISSPLYNCLLVNKLFYKITSEIISSKFYCHNEIQLKKFIENKSQQQQQQQQQNSNQCLIQPKTFILHKLFQTKQIVFDQLIEFINFNQLSWFELYMCPKICLNKSNNNIFKKIFQSCTNNLTKLIITGSKTIDDEFLMKFCQYKCGENLQILDLRACELITDFGIYQLSLNCRNLTFINLGRKANNTGGSGGSGSGSGRFITDNSIIKLINNNRKLMTIGLAGCHITDKVVWEIANKLPKISRLSLNNCPKLTNSGINQIFTLINSNSNSNSNSYSINTNNSNNNNNNNNCFFKYLSVLELRFNYQLIDLSSIIQFKRRQKFQFNIILLLELCESLMLKYRQQEFELDKLISLKIFQDISHWVNDYNDNDGDLSYNEIKQLINNNNNNNNSRIISNNS
ncbi:negative regulator of exit from mitosis, putative [Candida dubliniensis CD36]|uniref:Negative regulator of exit from mitosis, putative n=1 Tax=Candida dubliniensis (strain CD36 / ATCC MYA-646 / CBS 7987 / NCPF 3949 / NRRL Y-17841) TaxID=573826 RepID=B9WAN5_CANDC|nr:negative regulator of exit from mitosis, putative [Candida dubliniensis CD36]CAX43455.1 negative regulator of exit from mitosis, putative [Candida dubliniensis CD36]